MKAALRWTVGNLPLAVLALILATVAWAIAVEEEDPVRTQRYFQAIPLKTVGRPGGVFIVGGLTERVHVTVRAPESVWNDLVLDDFEAVVDLAGMEPGVHRLPVEVVINRQPAEVLLIEPQYVTLELQPWVERAVPVRVQVEGKPTLAYLAGSPIVTPTQVMVNGPSSYVGQVVEFNRGAWGFHSVSDPRSTNPPAPASWLRRGRNRLPSPVHPDRLRPALSPRPLTASRQTPFAPFSAPTRTSWSSAPPSP